MLGEAFLTWWHEPWRYGPRPAALAACIDDPLALRDAYPAWCRLSDMPAALPAVCEPEWQFVAFESTVRLRAASRLFAGLLSMRHAPGTPIAELTREERKWCASIASLQPLRGRGWAAGAGVEVDGLAELAALLDEQFAGLWPRLRWLFDSATVEAVARTRAQAGAALAPAAAQRARRCWRLCFDRIDQGGAFAPS